MCKDLEDLKTTSNVCTCGSFVTECLILAKYLKYCIFNLGYGFLKVPIFTKDVSMCYLRARIVVRPSTVSEKWESKGSCVLSSNCCRSLTRT